MEWISVKDRLPEIGESVLVYCTWKDEDEDADDYDMQFIGWIDTILQYGVGCKVNWSRDICGTVTHWMPLPEKP